MSDTKKIKYLSKTVAFNGKNLTLFSIDGQTWSSRKQELLEIKERQEQNKVSFVAIKEENGETRVAPKAKGKVVAEEEVDEIAISEEDESFPEVDYSTDEEKAAKVKRGRGIKLNAKAKAVKTVVAKKNLKSLPISKKNADKGKKRPIKVAPKKRLTGKPKVKPTKKTKKKAA